MSLLQDQNNQACCAPLKAIYFYLTSYCNLNCIHCWISPQHTEKKEAPEEADFKTLKEAIDQAMPLGLKGVKLTGGEPFLSRHALALVSYASEKKLVVTIETNGLLVDKDVAEFLKEKNVRLVAVSLDGPDAAVHERVRKKKGSFDKAVAAIKDLKSCGINTQVIFSVYRENVGYLEDTISLAESLGADSLKINPISAISRGGHLTREGQTLTAREYIDLNKKVEEEFRPRYKIRISLDIPLAFKKLKDTKEEFCGCGIKGIIGVLPDGRISICGIGEMISSLVLGDLRKEPLERIWRSSPILKSIREDIPRRLEGACGNCMLKGLCLGKCRAEAYYRSKKNIFSPFFFCEEANRLGLFPESRMLKLNREEGV